MRLAATSCGVRKHGIFWHAYKLRDNIADSWSLVLHGNLRNQSFYSRESKAVLEFLKCIIHVSNSNSSNNHNKIRRNEITCAFSWDIMYLQQGWLGDRSIDYYMIYFDINAYCLKDSYFRLALCKFYLPKLPTGYQIWWHMLDFQTFMLFESNRISNTHD